MILWLNLVLCLANAGTSPSTRTPKQDAPTADAEAAAATLSRFPAGHVPATEPVLTAITTLGTEGSRDNIALLSSLSDREEPEIQLAAEVAIEQLNQRTVDATRRSFSKRLPSDVDVTRWVRDHDADLARTNGTKLGRNDARMVAYAALVLDGIKASQVPTADDDQAAARDRELDTDAVQALVHYARGAADGKSEALEAIRAFGVDPERLLLGMSASPKQELVARVEPTAVEVLVREGSERTIAVLMERAEGGDTAEKVVAIDALGRMLPKLDTTSSTCQLAVGRLQSASRTGGSAAVRDTAKTALEETGGVCGNQ